MSISSARKRFPILVILILFGFAYQANSQSIHAAQVSKAPGPIVEQPSIHPAASGPSVVYLPMVSRFPGPLPVLLGVYSLAYMGTQQAVDQNLTPLDTWAGLSRAAGKGHSLYGDFIDLEVPNTNANVNAILETLWQNGYTTFVNLGSSKKASDIGNGLYDAAIDAWAQAYLSWISLGGNRKAFIAPLQEMNGNWIPYGLDPPGFKAAYKRIQDRFVAAGVPRNKVWWTFAPNGWTSPIDPPISAYYPGNSMVDVVALSAYNWGNCPAFPDWQSPNDVFGPYIQIIRSQVTATKPILIAETASASPGGDKDQWIRDAYSYLVQQNIRGILYLNADNECDWAVHPPGGRSVQGYKDAVSSSKFGYVEPAILSASTLLP